MFTIFFFCWLYVFKKICILLPYIFWSSYFFLVLSFLWLLIFCFLIIQYQNNMLLVNDNQSSDCLRFTEKGRFIRTPFHWKLLHWTLARCCCLTSEWKFTFGLALEQKLSRDQKQGTFDVSNVVNLFWLIKLKLVDV